MGGKEIALVLTTVSRIAVSAKASTRTCDSRPWRESKRAEPLLPFDLECRTYGAKGLMCIRSRIHGVSLISGERGLPTTRVVPGRIRAP